MSGQSSFKMGMSTKVGNIVNKKINKNKNPPIVNKMGGKCGKCYEMLTVTERR